MELTHEQLVDILCGIALAESAVINAVADREDVNKKIRPALRRVAGRGGTDPDYAAPLRSLYADILLSSLGQPHPISPAVRDMFLPTVQGLILKE